MDAGQLTTAMNFAVVKEPRGFIRILQVILAIFAFATTCGVSSYVTFSVKCSTVEDNSTHPYRIDFSYPFKLEDIKFEVTKCNKTNQNSALIEGSGSSSQFYVFIGVMAFLYGLGSLVLYVVFDQIYRNKNMIPIADFITTAVFAVLWLISSSAWAQGVSDVKYYTDPKTGVFPSLDACIKYACNSQHAGDFASLNVSIIFGFLNMLIWGASLWFLYKETSWFKSKESTYNPDSTMPQGPIGGSPTSPSAP